ncbi:MAG: PASTA domain-containing protein [Acidimicrobiales bacterium]|nr:PASTA domain-containing protein [Acidimicrobiales bacterium]
MTRDPASDPGAGDLPLGTHPLPFMLLLAIVAVAAVVASTSLAGLVGAGILEGGPTLVEVPDLVGDDEQQARTELQEAGLVPVIITAQNVQVPPGEVTAQEPSAGESVPNGTSVEVRVSVGDEFARAPDLRGSPSHELFLLLAAYGLSVGEVSYQQSDAAADEVLSQDPAPGKLIERGSTIDVVLSTGPPMIDIPDVRREPERDAVRILEDAGFEVHILDRYSGWVSRGSAVSTEPEADEQAPRGSRLILYISRGAPPTTTTSTTTPPSTTTTAPPTTSTTSTTTPGESDPSNPADEIITPGGSGSSSPADEIIVP